MSIDLAVGMDVDVVDFHDAKKGSGDRDACAWEKPGVASRTDLDQIATAHHSIVDEPRPPAQHRPIGIPSQSSTLAAPMPLSIRDHLKTWNDVFSTPTDNYQQTLCPAIGSPDSAIVTRNAKPSQENHGRHEPIAVC